MNDDEFSGFVSSGKKMRVSVSEHTGNAKNPKNIVTSNEEETLIKVHSFEDKEAEFEPLAHNAPKEQELRLDKIVTKPAKDSKNQKPLADKAPVENLQTIKQEPSNASNQALPKTTVAAAPNKQSVKTTAVKENLQSVATDTSDDNLQSIASDAQTDNRQSVGTDALKDNRQGIPSANANDNLHRCWH
jgi:hypothetical protein